MVIIFNPQLSIISKRLLKHTQSISSNSDVIETCNQSISTGNKNEAIETKAQAEQQT